MERIGWLCEMLHSLEVLKRERWRGASRGCGSRRRSGSSSSVGGGGVGLGGVGVRVMNIACGDPRGPAASCLRCRLFRRKQRLLAFLTASTGISFILLFLHTPSILLPHRALLTVEKELPERSHYVKKDVHLLGEAKKVSVVRGQLLRPPVYRNRYYGRKVPSGKKPTVKIETNSHDIFKSYLGGGDIVSADYFRRPTGQKQKSFERKLNLLELRNFKAFPDDGDDGDESERRRRRRSGSFGDFGPKYGEEDQGGGEEKEEDDDDEGVERWPGRAKHTKDVLRGPPRRHYFQNIDSAPKAEAIRASRTRFEKLLQSSSSGPPRLALTSHEGGRGGGGGGEGEGVDDPDAGESDMENEADGFHHLIIVFNYKRPAYFPWRTTRDECANYATRFMVAGGAPIVAAVSFPGAGNTWLRYITEVLSGIFTGSVYHDETLALKGFWGERDGYRQGTTIIQKTHSFPLLPDEVKDGIYNGQEFRFLVPAEPRKVVVLLRNPWESLLALRHYHAAGHTGFANMAFFKGPEWANFTSERAQLWVQLYTAWLSLPNTHVHVVHYEHLQHGLEKEAKRLVKFLGLTLDYGRLECLIRYPEGRFRRPKYPKHLQGYNFPSASANILRDGMGSVDSLLRQGDTPASPPTSTPSPLPYRIRSGMGVPRRILQYLQTIVCLLLVVS